LKHELTDLIFIGVRKLEYSILLLRVYLSQELGVPEVAAVVLFCLGAPPRRRHLA
jgi:hypothetical protein